MIVDGFQVVGADMLRTEDVFAQLVKQTDGGCQTSGAWLYCYIGKVQREKVQREGVGSTTCSVQLLMSGENSGFLA